MTETEHTVAVFRRADGELRVIRTRRDGETITRLRRYHLRDGELRAGQVLSVLDHELGDLIGVLRRIAAKVASSSGDSGDQRARSSAHRTPTHRTRKAEQTELADIDEEGLF